MTRTMFGMLAAGAVAGLLGSLATAENAMAKSENGEAKACYRKSCGKSVKGHEGSCGGTKVEDISDQKTCEDAGGAWADAKEAEKLAH